MEKELKQSIRIAATQEAVWDALVNPDTIERYMFGSKVKTDWQPGSSMDYFMAMDDQQVKIVHGKIVKVVAPSYFEHTVFPTTWEGMEDKPENHLATIYEIAQVEGGVELTVTQHDFTTVDDGEKRYEDAQKGWEVILPKIKKIVEE